MRVGELEILPVMDGVATMPPSAAYTQAGKGSSPDDWTPHKHLLTDDGVLSSGTDRALLLGDVVHCPVELLDDEWAGLGDVDADLALRTRIALAKELEGTDTPAAAAHFPGMQFGRLIAANGKRQWVAT